MFKKFTALMLTLLLMTGCVSETETQSQNSEKPQPTKTGEKFILSLVDCDDAYISRGYGGYEGHQGVDVACPEGVYIYAADSGVVTHAVKMNMGYGIYCIIRHEGYETLYAHCSDLAVKKGDTVEKGKVIGTAGNTGNSTGPHLHFEVIADGERQDPELWYK